MLCMYVRNVYVIPFFLLFVMMMLKLHVSAGVRSDVYGGGGG